MLGLSRPLEKEEWEETVTLTRRELWDLARSAEVGLSYALLGDMDSDYFGVYMGRVEKAYRTIDSSLLEPPVVNGEDGEDCEDGEDGDEDQLNIDLTVTVLTEEVSTFSVHEIIRISEESRLNYTISRIRSAQ